MKKSDTPFAHFILTTTFICLFYSLNSVKTATRFSSLAWGPMTTRSGGQNPSAPHGLIVGGMSDGIVSVWDAGALLQGAGEHAQLARVERHKAAVRSVQFNPHVASSHLLAAGSADGDISIINLENPSMPTVASPITATTRLEHEITSVAWNSSVPHILATGTNGGSVVVWDLKENRPWCTLKDPHRSSVSEICWHPDEGLFLVTACDDDSRPVLRIWDLRSSTTTPLTELIGHTKGVLSVDWCAEDSNLLASCAKDSKTYIWDLQQGRVIGEVPYSQNSSSSGGSSGGGGGYSAPKLSQDVLSAPPSASSLFGAPPPSMFGGAASTATNVFGSNSFAGSDAGAAGVFGGGTLAGVGGMGGSAGAGRRYSVRWSKKVRASLATCSFDRKVTIHHVAALGPSMIPQMPTGYGASTEATFRRSPKWMRRPVGATFGFGGKIVSFGTPLLAQSGNLRTASAEYPKRIQLGTVTTNLDLTSRAAQFERILSEVESGASDVRRLCSMKSTLLEQSNQMAASAEWTFMRLIFEQDSRRQLLSHLGYEASAVQASVASYTQQSDFPYPAAQNSDGTAGPTSGDGQTAAASHAHENGLVSEQHLYQDQQDHYLHQQQLQQQQQQQFQQQTTEPPRTDGGIGSWGMAAAGGGSDGAGGGGSAVDFFGSSSPRDAISAGDLFGSSAPSSDFGNSGSSSSSSTGNGVSEPPLVSAASSGTDSDASSTTDVRDSGAVDGGYDESGSLDTRAGPPLSRASSNSASINAPLVVEDSSVTYVRKRAISPEDDEVLKRCLLVGDIHAAVAVCFKQDRLDDALLLAAWHSPELLIETRDKFFKRKAVESLSAPTMAAIVTNDLPSLVQTSPLSNWKDTLATLCTWASVENFSQLCDVLGDRLVDGGHAESAVLTYMFAQSTNKAISIWRAQTDALSVQVGDRLASLEDIVQRSVILRKAALFSTGTDATALDQPEASHLVEYAMNLAEEGHLGTSASYAVRIAMQHPKQMQAPDGSIYTQQPSTASVLGAVLRDRLYRAFSNKDFAISPTAQQAYAALQQSAYVPFQLKEVGIAPIPIAESVLPPEIPLQQQQQHQQQQAFGVQQHQVFAQPQPQHIPSQPLHMQHHQQQHQQAYALPQQQQQHGNTFPSSSPQNASAFGSHSQPKVPTIAAAATSTAMHPSQQQQHQPVRQSFAPPPAPAQAVAQALHSNSNAYHGQPNIMQQQSQQTHQPSVMKPMQPSQQAQPAPVRAVPGSGFGTPATNASSQFIQPAAPAAAIIPPPQAAPIVQLRPVSNEIKFVLDTLRSTIESLRPHCSGTLEARQLTEANTYLDALQERYQSSRMTDEVVRKLVQLAQACAAYDYKTAQKLQQDLANTDWTNTKEWHKGVRSVVMLAMIKSGGK